MPSTPDRRRWTAAALVLSASLAAAGCSRGGGADPAPPQAPAGLPAAEAGSNPVGVSAGGVTTRIDVPAQSTEEQYAQACLAAKEWMVGRGGDPHTLVEPYLKEIQASAVSGPATFMSTWARLTDAQRAGIIIAVRAAADGGC